MPFLLRRSLPFGSRSASAFQEEAVMSRIGIAIELYGLGGMLVTETRLAGLIPGVRNLSS